MSRKASAARPTWLRTAPPARRELVVISDFQLGALDAAMLRDLPSHVGIRLVRTSGAPVTRTADGQPRTQRTTASAGGGRVHAAKPARHAEFQRNGSHLD